MRRCQLLSSANSLPNPSGTYVGSFDSGDLGYTGRLKTFTFHAHAPVGGHVQERNAFSNSSVMSEDIAPQLLPVLPSNIATGRGLLVTGYGVEKPLSCHRFQPG